MDTNPSTPRKSLEPWILDTVQYYPHQISGIRALARRKNFLLADDMGLGKSLQAMTVFAIDVIQGFSKTAIVVAPVTLKGNWSDEIDKFTRFPHVVLEGSPAKRTKQLEAFREIEGPKILVVNYEQVISHFDDLDRLRFDVAIFDEAHYLKNYKTKRTKACMNLFSTRSFLLTGTPILNHVNELWPLLHRIDAFKWPRYWTFVNRYAVFGGFKDKQIVGVKNETELIDRLQSIMLRRLKEDVLDLPDVQILERRVDLLPEQRRLYNKVFDDMQLERADGSESEDIENALTKFLRLKQICGTTLPFTGVDQSSKLDLALEDDLEILSNGRRVIVFTQFRDVQAAYVKRLRAAGVKVWELHGDVPMPERVGVVKSWGSSPEPGVIVCMLQVAGIGLNMTAARDVSFLDKLFVPGLNKQAIDRAHRIGQSTTQPVLVREYLCRNTVELRVNQILGSKKKVSDSIIEVDEDLKRSLYQAMMEEARDVHR